MPEAYTWNDTQGFAAQRLLLLSPSPPSSLPPSPLVFLKPFTGIIFSKHKYPILDVAAQNLFATPISGVGRGGGATPPQTFGECFFSN